MARVARDLARAVDAGRGRGRNRVRVGRARPRAAPEVYQRYFSTAHSRNHCARAFRGVGARGRRREWHEGSGPARMEGAPLLRGGDDAGAAARLVCGGDRAARGWRRAGRQGDGGRASDVVHGRARECVSHEHRGCDGAGRRAADCRLLFSLRRRVFVGRGEGAAGARTGGCRGDDRVSFYALHYVSGAGGGVRRDGRHGGVGRGGRADRLGPLVCGGVGRGAAFSGGGARRVARRVSCAAAPLHSFCARALSHRFCHDVECGGAPADVGKYGALRRASAHSRRGGAAQHQSEPLRQHAVPRARDAVRRAGGECPAVV